MKRVLLLLLVLVLAALAVAKFFVFELPTVTGDDMAPALQAEDLLLACRLDRTPARGDLVLFAHPGEGHLLVRRVVAVPGDRVAVRNEVPILNGEAAPRTAQGEAILLQHEGGLTQEVRMKRVEEELSGVHYTVLKDPRRRSKDLKEQKLVGAYFLLADNRNHGADSRSFGPVPQDKIRAVVTHRVMAGPGSIKDQATRQGWFPLSP